MRAFFHSPYCHLVLMPFLTGPEILQLAGVSRSLHTRMGLASRHGWLVYTDDPRFGMVSVPLHPVRTIARIQRLFPHNTGYCITSRVHLTGTQPTRYNAFREDVDHATHYLSLQDDRPGDRRQIGLVGAWVSQGLGGNIGPDVLKNTHGVVFHLHESAYCPSTCVLPHTIANPDEVYPVLSNRREPATGFLDENPNTSPLYNWRLDEYREMLSVRSVCILVGIVCVVVTTWILILVVRHVHGPGIDKVT